MKTVTIKANQTTLDMIIASCGTLEGGMAIMAANQQSISTNFPTGTVYAIPDDLTTDNDTLNYFMQNNIELGTFAQAI